MKRLLVIASLALAALVVPAAKTEAVAISFVPQNQTVGVGANVSVDIVVSGLGVAGALGLGAFDIDITLSNPAIVSFSSYSLGSNLGVLGVESDDFSFGYNAGVINLSHLSYLTPAQLLALQGPAGGSFTIGSLNFVAASIGTTFLNITFNVLADETGLDLTPNTTSGQGQINVRGVSIPEPSALLMIGPAALGLLASRRWRKRKTEK